MSGKKSESHPPTAVLERFASGTASADDRRVVVRHLLKGCAMCGQVASGADRNGWSEGVTVDAFLERSAQESAELVARFCSERSAAAEIVQKIAPLTGAQRRLLLNNLPAKRRRAVCELLIERSRESRHHNARETLTYAELAVLVSQGIEGTHADEPRSRAWAELGNARRILADLAGAEQALDEAERLFDRGGADPLFQAELYSLRGSLAQYQRRFDLAFQLLHRSFRLFERHEDLNGATRALLKLALAHVYRGDPEEGLPHAERALALAAGSEDTRLKLYAFHNLVLILTEAGRVDEAAWHAHRVRPLFDAAGHRLDRLRFDWLTTRIGAELGVLEPAARAFDRLRKGYADEGMPFEAALVSLDLAAVYARLGERRKLRLLAQETQEILRSLGVGRDHLAALFLLARSEGAEAVRLVANLRKVVEGARDGRHS
ncbi:MAG: tetratricopeptide repeat protein [Acidobacteriota bacterium]